MLPLSRYRPVRVTNPMRHLCISFVSIVLLYLTNVQLHTLNIDGHVCYRKLPFPQAQERSDPAGEGIELRH